MNAPRVKKASSAFASSIRTGATTIAPAAMRTTCSSVRPLRANCASNALNKMPEPESDRPHRPDRSFTLVLAPIVAASVPSLLFCALALVLWLHTAPTRAQVTFHFPPLNLWDHLFALQLSLYQWVAHWNSAVTLAATAFLVSTLLLPRWRHFAFLALIPYGLLLCADFTLRWR